MPIKNYTTKVSAERSIAEIHRALVAHGASGVLYDYEPGGRVASIAFKLPSEIGIETFSLPANWRAFKQVLNNSRARGYYDDDRIYNVAWRCLRDWVLAQMALYETRMVELPQVFFPFATAGKGKTVYELMRSNQLQLVGRRDAPLND